MDAQPRSSQSIRAAHELASSPWELRLDARSHPLLWVFAVVHAIVGTWSLWMAAAASFAGAWFLVAVAGPLLFANALGATLRRDAIDRKISRAIAMTLRVGGGLTLVVGALAMRSELDGAWTVMGVSLAIGSWGVAYGWVLDRSDDAFARA
jgi:hypothetical protein